MSNLSVNSKNSESNSADTGSIEIQTTDMSSFWKS